ncbi:hypothetical protein [Alteromonas sp. a30]|uniref:hypothetical protein n=1 Tax=Alteromonas sp. a30 TaxID=2730917 RepID=UPI0022816F00|nr:hypothetical protein [Alteromonas sp. a30]MCY7294952.1 hypothetical protein [Alteromonas sp. a30]
MKVANPQGKGLVTLFSQWHPPLVVRETRDLPTLMKDYLLSLMVLSAKFKFRPVVNTPYFLYLKDNQLILTLIEPQTNGNRFGKFVGNCKLKPELTWDITFSEESKSDTEIQTFIENFYAGFKAHHDQNVELTSLLPFFENSLPFYARMYANGLAKSIGLGVKQLGLAHINAGTLLVKNDDIRTFLIQ